MPDIEIVESHGMRFAIAASVHLESAGPVTDWSRWNYLAGTPKLLLRCDSATRETALIGADGVIQRWDDPTVALAWMAKFQKDHSSDGPPFVGGWIGWLSYDLGQVFEPIPSTATCRDDLHLPLFEFGYHDRIWATNRRSGTKYEIRASKILDRKPIDIAPILPSQRDSTASPELRGNFTRAGYEGAVQRAIDYIAAGDIFQVNLAQRLTTGLRESPQTIFARLHQQSGASHGAYLEFDDHALICDSPELFLRVSPDRETGKRHVVTRPIKGTRPSASGMDTELRESQKDQAELNMIADLERNDLGRICEIGSVKVTNPREIEAHPTVYHGVATIEGTLRDDVSFVDILRATFPGGSITGAPKIRAMQIIEELEPTRRGPYCGAIGFVSNSGHIEFNIAIRTMIATAGQIHIPVGAGIVADSIPAAEYEETLVKSKAMLRALGLSTDQLLAAT